MIRQIPIGYYFEEFVILLKVKLRVFFDAVSTVLSVAIDALKNILLISPGHLYASITFVILLALLVALLVRRRRHKLFVPALVIAIVCLAGVETWRIQSINREISPQAATEQQTLYQGIADQLEAKQKLTTPPTALLEAIMEQLSAIEPASAEVKGALRTTRTALRHINNARSTDSGRIADNLTDVRDTLLQEADSIQLAAGQGAELQEQTMRWQALAAANPVKRMVRELGGVTEPQPMATFISQRNYERLVEALRATANYYGGAGDDASLSQAAEQVLEVLQPFNPERLQWYSPLMLIVALAILAYLIAGWGVAVFALVGLALIVNMQLWEATIESLALVLAATLFALLIGIPLGVAAVRSKPVDQALRPLLDLMQTMPAFVYLIPAVIFFGLGEVPGAIATLIFSMPPAVRLTTLGIRQVPTEIVEAAESFGSTDTQMLFKAQLPIALPTILAGVNQTIMLSLSMVVIAGMIGAGGLGSVVLTGITQMKLGLGFEGGLAVVILAIYLDRVTQAMGKKR